MKRSGEEILADIDATLDQLIRNADAIKGVSANPFYENEVEALQKTQESLLARLMHMDKFLDLDLRKRQFRRGQDPYHEIQQKLAKFGRLNARLINDVAVKFASPKKKKKTFAKKPRIGRNRRKAKVQALVKNP